MKIPGIGNGYFDYPTPRRQDMLAIGAFWILAIGCIGMAFLQSFGRETAQNQSAVDGWWWWAIIFGLLGLFI